MPQHFSTIHIAASGNPLYALTLVRTISQLINNSIDRKLMSDYYDNEIIVNSKAKNLKNKYV